MIVFLFGLMGLGWMWGEREGFPKVTDVRPPSAGRTFETLVGCLESMQMAGIHGPPPLSRGFPQPLHIRAFG